MVTSDGGYTERENTLLISGRAASSTLSTGSSVHSGVSFDLKGRGFSGESLVDALATSDSFSYGLGQQFAALHAEEAKILAEHILGQCSTICKRRTRAEERRLKNTA